MAKKILIPSGQLPNIIDGQQYVFVRYRIVSEDRNRISAWTPTFAVTPPVGGYRNEFVGVTEDLQDTFNLSLVL